MNDRIGLKFMLGVHQGSVLSPLLFAVVLDEITKDVREGILKEFLYADDLVLLGNSWIEVEERYSRRKTAMEEKGLRVNVGKTKAFCTGEKIRTKVCVKDPCPSCGKGVGSNSIQCQKCSSWVHKRYTKLKGSLLNVKNFESRTLN